jgi:hypothetical protein
LGLTENPVVWLCENAGMNKINNAITKEVNE